MLGKILTTAVVISFSTSSFAGLTSQFIEAIAKEGGQNFASKLGKEGFSGQIADSITRALKDQKVVDALKKLDVEAESIDKLSAEDAFKIYKQAMETALANNPRSLFSSAPGTISREGITFLKDLPQDVQTIMKKANVPSELGGDSVSLIDTIAKRTKVANKKVKVDASELEAYQQGDVFAFLALLGAKDAGERGLLARKIASVNLDGDTLKFSGDVELHKIVLEADEATIARLNKEITGTISDADEFKAALKKMAGDDPEKLDALRKCKELNCWGAF